MRCDFNKEKHLIRAYAIYIASNGDSDDLAEGLANAFNNPEIALRAVTELVGGVQSSTSSASVRPQESYERNQESDNISSYYVGGVGFMQMQTKFREAILAASILKLNKETGDFEYIDNNSQISKNCSAVQANILTYKEQLLNNLVDALPEGNPAKNRISLSLNISNEDYTNYVHGILQAYENYISTINQNQLEGSNAYDSYVILKNFDNLLKKNASYIHIDESYRNEGVGKYSYIPKVSHFSNFSRDEGANIMTQISNIAETILKLIPDVDEYDKPLASSINVSGFNGAMQTFKTALLYGNNLGEHSKDFRKSYLKGAGEFLNGEYSIADAIDAFIENNRRATAEEGTSAFNSFRQVYLHNKLRGIKKYLLSPKTPAEIKHIFVQMLYKTESTGYRVYNIDQESNLFKGSNLVSRMVVTQKSAITSQFNSGLKMLLDGSKITASSLLKNYHIDVVQNGNNEIMTITDNNGESVNIAYGITSNSTLRVGPNAVTTNSPNIVAKFLESAFAFTVPDTYESCITNPINYKWENDFAPFIVMAAKAAGNKIGMPLGQNINLSKDERRNVYDLNAYNKHLLAIGQRLGVIYGDSVRNVINSLSGNKLPLFQLTSLEYNWQSCLDDAKEIINDRPNPIMSSLIWDNEDLILAPQIRNEVQFGGKTKSASSLTTKELLKINLIDDFFMPFLHGEDAIYLQNTTFSDKLRQFLPGYNLNSILKGNHINQIYGRDITLREIIDDSLKNGSFKLDELVRNLKRDRYISIGYNILSDYAEVYPEIELSFELDFTDTGAQNLVSQFEKLDNYLQTNNLSVASIRNKFKDSNIDFIEEIHAYEPKNKKLGGARINETFLNYLRQTSNKSLWQTAQGLYWNKFQKDLSSLVLNGFDYNMNPQIEELLTWNAENNFNSDLFYNPQLKEFRFVSESGYTHPIVGTFFCIDQLLSGEYNTLMMGDVFAHPNKNKSLGKDDTEYLEFSEASRFVNQIKRSVIFGSTIHPFGQGIFNDKGYDVGVTPEIDIAVIQDKQGWFYTPNGNDDTLDSQDGSGYCTALQSRLENNSVLDAAVGDNKKTIIHDVDPLYGKPTLLKWAVYALTNSYRRNGFGSKTNVENLVRRLYGKSINNPSRIDLASIYTDYVKNNGNIYIQDQISLEYKELVGLSKDINGNWIRNYSDGTSSRPIAIHTLYDIDQVFGGAWTFTKNNNGTFKGNEASVDLLTETAIEYDLRDKQIAYAVNASACKVGATNLNDESAWEGSDPLKTYKIHTKYGGIMMDADHELEQADVTEMSQMISSLIEDGRYTDLVTDLYSEIGEIAFNNDKIQKYIKAVDSNDRVKIAELLGKSLLASFETGNKDTIGLAQAFIKRFDREFKSAQENGKVKSTFEYKIPFSDATIFGAFVADVTSRLTKDGIRRKYEGYAGVLNPSHDTIQYFLSNGNAKMYKEFNEECRERLLPYTEINENGLRSGQSLNGDWIYYQSWQELAYKSAYMSDGTFNPFWVSVDRNDIDFEDTIMVERPDGTFDEIYIKNFEIYDRIRNLGAYSGLRLFKNTAAPRNLRGTDTTFEVRQIVNGIEQTIGTFSYYNIDSIRATQYLAAGLNVNDPYYTQKKALVDSVLLRGDQTILSPIERCKDLTQQFLERLDLGKARANKLNVGEALTDDDYYAQFEWNQCFGDKYNVPEAVYYASNYNVRPAEIIMGRYQMEKLGLTSQDHIWQIKDSMFFLNKLKSQFAEPELNISNVAYMELYDKVLYHNGIPFLVKIGQSGTHNNEISESEVPEFNVVDSDLRWESEIILTDDDNPEKLKEFKCTRISDGKHTYNLITVNSEEDYDMLEESNFFENFVRNNPLGSDADDNDSLNYKLNKLAEDRYEAFKQALNFVGARIPTQAMQSYMPFTVICFADTDYNQVYVPKANTGIEGSDYDIDKLYLLTATILQNGKIQSGSAIQKKLGYATTINLFKPNGVNYVEANNGFVIPEKILLKFAQNPSRWDRLTRNQFVYYANKLSQIEPIDNNVGVTFIGKQSKQFEWGKQNFLNLLNKHSHTRGYLRDSLDTLKTRVFNGVWNVTLGAQSQLKAQIRVDDCTGELKNAAANTTSGDEEKRVSPNIPSSKYKMQEQNILGKNVVGIGAVSLKTYFILSTSNNRKCSRIIDALKKQDYDSAMDILSTMIIINPVDGSQTTIGNTNLNQVIRLAKRAPDTWERKQEFLSILQTLKQNTSKISTPEFLSGIISLAADNAKDLALPKLNATEDLVDIYTTAAMIGIPFSTIKDIMTSDVFTWLTKVGKNDIFDNVTDSYNVKNTLDFILGNYRTEYGRSADIVNRVIGLYNNYANKNNLSLVSYDKYTNSDLNNILATFTTGLMEEFPEYISDQAWENYQNAIENVDGSSKSNINIPLNKKQGYELYRLFKIIVEGNAFLSTKKEHLKIISRLVNYSKEMTALGQQGAINQGIKTNIYSLNNFMSNIQDLINRKVKEKARSEHRNAAPNEFFNFTTFLFDPEYRNYWINRRDLVSCFNILEALADSPHFFNMSRIVPYAYSLLGMSHTFRQVMGYNELLKDSHKLSENDFSELVKYVNDKTIFNFLTEGNITLDLDRLSKLTNTPIEVYTSANVTDRKRELTLNSMLDIASFKHIMESVIIPYLKVNPIYANNSFIRDLQPTNDKNGRTIYTLPIPMMQIDSDEGLSNKYLKYLRDFNSLAKDTIADQNLGGLFFLYNLYVNKNSFGDNSLTRIFEDLVDSKNSPKIIQDYYQYISNLDSSEDWTISATSQGEAAYRLSKYSRGSKFLSPFGRDFELPEDFMFDLPITAGIGDTTVINMGKANLTSWMPIGKIDVTEVLNTFAAKLNSVENNIIQIVDDDYVNENNLPKERGFIKDGKVYINQSAFRDSATALGVGIHEITHLIAAAIKAKPIDDPTRKLYYELLQKVSKDQDFNEIASRYPDRVGSDIAEEVLCNKIQKILTNKINNNSNIELGIMNGKLIIEGFNSIFSDSKATIEDIISTNSIEEALEKFAYSMFDFVSDIKKNFIKQSQTLAALKTWLLDKGDENNNLKQECK